jgi:UDP-glucose 4-epimerase
VYGSGFTLPISECEPCNPINPYGRSKLMIEQVLYDLGTANPEFSYAILRYYNVAGAASDGSLGEDHCPETHLIPSILQVALEKRTIVTVNGTDYPTADGTCIRDYVHVEDVCDAHIKAMEALKPSDGLIYNVGLGRGYSVNEVIKAAKKIVGARKINVTQDPRRPGDPANLVANSSKIRKELGWSPKHTTIEPMIQSAWNWMLEHPKGYAA